jgi:DnaK suppressor protein
LFSFHVVKLNFEKLILIYFFETFVIIKQLKSNKFYPQSIYIKKPNNLNPFLPFMNNINKTRYSDEDLEEFRQMIDKKLIEATEVLEDLKQQLAELNNNGDENKAGTFDDGASTWQREHVNKLASRQQRFIRDLEHALIRIKNKTYGICSVTGQLIKKERLLLVPHATKTVEGKTQQSDRKEKKIIQGTENNPESAKKDTKGVKSELKKGENFEEEFEIIDDEDYIEDFTEPQDNY